MKNEKTHRAPRLTARVELKDGAMRGALHIYDFVGGWDGIRAKDVIAKLDELKDQGAEHLDVHVNSGGGSVFEGMAIHTAIATWSKGRKIVHVDGLAASIASIIAMAGDEIHIAPTAMVMVHEPSDWSAGTADDMRKCADKLDAIRGVMCGVYAKRTGLKLAEIEKMVAEETWMSADQAVAKGFADKVVAPEEEPDQGDPNEDGEEEDRAVALFRRPPPHLKQLLHLSLPVAKAAGASQETTVTFEELKTKLAEATQQVTSLTARAETAEKAKTESDKLASELLAATGKPSAGEALAMVAGLKEQAAQAAALSEKLAKFETEKKTAEVKALFDAACKDGRLTPARRAELEKAEAPAFARDPAQLKVFLDCLQPVAAVTTEAKAAPVPPAGEPVVTDEIKKIAEQCGLDPKVVAQRSESVLKR